MKGLVLFPISLIFLVFTSLVVPAQTNKKLEIQRIDAYCKSIDLLTKKRKGPELIFADISEDIAGVKPKWRKFVSEKALENFREKSETYTIAYVWRKNGKIVTSNFTLFSGSGDWAKYVYSYFGSDGTLARTESELRTFYGDYIVIRRRYFDRAGKLLRRTDKYLDLQTQKPKKPTSEFVGENSTWNEVDYFKKTSRLPFAYLLKKK